MQIRIKEYIYIYHGEGIKKETSQNQPRKKCTFKGIIDQNQQKPEDSETLISIY